MWVALGSSRRNGVVSSLTDQLRRARFHLGDGRSEGGTRVRSAETLHRVRGPTVPLRASTVQQAVVRRALEHGLQGQRGYFSRGEDGAVTGVDLAGRLVTRV